MSELDISDAVLAELRSAADIVEVASDHTRLKKAGRSWKGLCPFHSERTPSFTVDREKGLYHCFGCGAGGDVIHFVRQMERLGFPEAVESLASRFGVSIPRRAPRGPRDERREKLYEAVGAAQRFYSERLAKPGNPAAQYLKERGVPAELSRRLGLGYAPDSWDALSRALSGTFPESLLLEAGLLQPRQEAKGSYDRFRDRLLFVVRDARGRPVGFGGRALSAREEPKYLNSPESPIFQKKRLLYGLSEARDAIRRRDRVVVVEGYFDHLALLRAGIEEVISSMGTALTSEQAQSLKRLSPRVVLCYDGDTAGRAATKGALTQILAEGLAVSVAPLPEGQDPDDLLRREGAASLASRIEQASDYLTWLLEELRPEEAGLSSAEKKERIDTILEILSSIPDPILRYEEYRKVARRVSIPVEVLWGKKGTPERRPPAREEGTPESGRLLSGGEIPAAERRLLQILASSGRLNPLILETLQDKHLTHQGVRKLVGVLRQANTGSEPIDFRRNIPHVREESEILLLSRVALEDGPEPTEEEVARLLKRLEIKHLQRERAALQEAIRRAEAANQAEEVSKLLRTKQGIGRRIMELGR